jgi:signal transduction histidine kinase
MQIHSFKFIIGVLLAVLFHSAAFAAGEHASREDAVALVKKAAAYIKQNGRDKALDEFNNPKGKFVDGELYIVVLDLNGVLLADGTKPKLAGKSLLDIKDVNGKQFVREEVDLARTKGKGWVDFEWVNPVTKTMEPRSTYFERVDDLIVLTGVYNRR